MGLSTFNKFYKEEYNAYDREENKRRPNRGKTFLRKGDESVIQRTRERVTGNYYKKINNDSGKMYINELWGRKLYF